MMDNRGNGIDYIMEKSSIPEEFKSIVEMQCNNTCDILKQLDKRYKENNCVLQTRKNSVGVEEEL